MKAFFTTLIAATIILSASAQVSFYFDNQLVDQTQEYYFESSSTYPNFLLSLENNSSDTIRMYVDVCVIEDGPAWEMNSCVWGHENNIFGGIHAPISHDTSNCWEMYHHAFEVELLVGEQGLMANYFDVSGSGCEKYRFYVRDENTVIDSIDIRCCSTLGLGEQQNEEIEVYLNPASDLLDIRAGSNLKMIELVDLQGRIVLSEETNAMHHQMNVTSLTPGLYRLNLLLDGGLRVTKSIFVR